MNRLGQFLAIALVATACSKVPEQQTPTANPDDATARGHEAAWTVAHTDHNDTIALQRAILDARAIHDEYVLTGDDDAAQDFEQAFADSLRHADPELANEIFEQET